MIDIVIPCYNSEDTLRDVLDGILCQSYKDYWVYIIDNNSSDKSIDSIISHKLSKKTTIIKNSKNIGFVRNVRKSLSYGTNKYTALCSSNDVLYPDYLERLLEAHNENTSLTYGLSDFYINDKLVKKPTPVEYFDTTGLDTVKRFELVMSKFTYSAPFWGLYKKDALTKMSPFPFNRGGDHVFVADASLYGDVRMVGECLFKRNYPDDRKENTFSIMESDMYLEKEDLKDFEGWHNYPYISMMRSHHEIVKRAALPNEVKEVLMKSVIKIIGSRFSDLIVGELKRYGSIKRNENYEFLKSYVLSEVDGYMNYLENYIEVDG